jgi:hypothetical protein
MIARIAGGGGLNVKVSAAIPGLSNRGEGDDQFNKSRTSGWFVQSIPLL